MGQATAYKKVMRWYETAQNDAHNLRDRRQANLYKTLPRVHEIDREMAKLGLSLARLALGADTAAVKQSGDTARAAYSQLAEEKAALFQSAGIPDNYLNDVYQCAACADTGFVNTQTAVAERCTCLKQKLIDQYYTMSNLGDVLARENFGTFRPEYFCEEMHPDVGLSPRKNIESIRKAAELFVKQVAENRAQDFAKSTQNMLFYGTTGLGKTFLCHCIAKALLDTGCTVLYVTAPRLFKLIQTQQFNRSNADDTEEKLDAVQEADLLILDDLGAEFSNIITDSALFDVVNQRLLDGRATVISTNLTLGELEEQYTERIVSRFIGNYKWFKFFGDDLRVKQAERMLGK
ncbi:MAG: ATP-binding protein [Defluviitaleaceae bacterium]|nr:ATP-binding protein [Defluviitaleaceae bacterium]